MPEEILGLGADIPNLEAADRTAHQGSQGLAGSRTDRIADWVEARMESRMVDVVGNLAHAVASVADY